MCVRVCACVCVRVCVRFLSGGRALQSELLTDEEHLRIHAQQFKAYFTAKPPPPLPPLCVLPVAAAAAAANACKDGVIRGVAHKGMNRKAVVSDAGLMPVCVMLSKAVT